MRLDAYLVSNGYFESRNKAQYEIKEGNVLVDGKIITKASFDIENGNIEILNTLKYVSKGGLKLEKALSFYSVDPTNFNCLDIGASTGGFTDCLLQNGAKEIYAIDTGINQLHESLLKNPKVHSFEKTNFLNFDLKQLPKIDLIVIDVSFVKVENILKRVIESFKNCKVIFLIKPQFELGKTYIKNGVVKDPKLHKTVIDNIKLFLNSYNIKYFDVIDSPILGGSGNKEFLLMFNL